MRLCSSALHMCSCQNNSANKAVWLQLGRVFQAQDQTTVQKHITKSASTQGFYKDVSPTPTLKTLPAPLHASNAVREREILRPLRAT